MADSLLYPGRINALNGEPGGGKTWVALQAAAEVIKAGGHVIFVDLEDHAPSTIARLRALGCDDDDIRERFHYVKPDRPMSPEALEYLEARIVELGVVLVVIDSVGELMSLQSVKPNDDDAVAALYRSIPRRLAACGPAVLLVDHVPKDNTTSPLYAIGSQRKRAAVDGASFMVSTVKAFAAGHDGILKLVTAKDRLGNFVTGQAAAVVTVTSSEDGSRIGLDVAEPDVMGATGEVRQTSNMAKMSRFLEGQPGKRAIRADIEKYSGVSSRNVSTVIKQLVAEGCAEDKHEGPGLPRWVTLLRPFVEGSVADFAAVHNDDGAFL